MAPSATHPSKTWQSALLDAPEAKVHVLVACVPIYGHFEKLRIIAADLVRRGYKVSFLEAMVYKDSIEKLGANFVPLQGLANWQSNDVTVQFPERSTLTPGIEQLWYDMRHCFMAPTHGQYSAVQKFLSEAVQAQESVVIVQDTMFMGTFPPLLGGPGLRPNGLISIGITPVTVSSIDTAPFNFCLPPDSSPEGRVRNLALSKQQQQAFSQPQSDWVQRMLEIGATEASSWFLDALTLLPDRYLQLCIDEVEYPRSDAPAGLRFVGALPSGLYEALPLPSWWDVIVKHEKRLVVVSQGTASNDPEELIIPTLKALKDIDIQVVATLVRSDHIEGFDVPSNALIAKFIPFDELFKYTDLVVSNGGYGTIQQALSAGVPLVLAGMSEDKPEANARTAWTGAAINLATQTPQIDQVKEAVEKILGTSTYNARARELQALYAKADSLGSIAATVDELAFAASKQSKLNAIGNVEPEKLEVGSQGS